MHLYTKLRSDIAIAICPLSPSFREVKNEKTALPAEQQREQSHAISLIYEIHLVYRRFRKVMQKN
jgi:hypothetical protein